MTGLHLNSDMMVGSGQPRSSTSSTVEFWSEKEKHLLTFIPKVPSGWEMWALGDGAVSKVQACMCGVRGQEVVR